MSLPLTGLKVLDLSRLLPGPYATLVLADLGAQVDKLEDPQGGDYIRQMAPFRGDDSALFYALNRNKRSITLDLKKPEAIEAFRTLIKGYDVLVESFRPGVMDKLGLGYAALSELNPRLIYCSISGYGATGPDRLRAGHDLNYIARAGALGYGGTPADLSFPGVQMADIGGGSLFSLVGILAALYERHTTGRGRFVDMSMTDGAVAFLHMHLAARLVMGKEGAALERGREALNGGYASYRPYKTSDGKFLAVGALEPKFGTGFFQALGRVDLLGDAYDTGEKGQAVQREVERIIASQPLAHWKAIFSKLDLCVEPVNEGDDVLEDPQLRARGLFVEAEDKERGIKVTHLRTPVLLGELPTVPPPRLGQHTKEILEEAGLGSSVVAALTGSGG
ncbi:MAG: CaiB/BaiF CoA transferase family protein [Myxococcaceae bacterium]